MFRQRVHVLSVLAAVLIFAGIGWASRNSGGTYSLPAGNPVVTGTVITSTWANTTLSDIKNEITNSLDRQGRGGMLAPLQLTNGTAAAPSLTFTSEPSSGLYRAGAGDERFSVLTTDVWKWATAANQSLVPLTVTGRTTTTDLTVTGTSAALAVVSTTANLRGLSVIGGSAAPGIVTVGGATSGRGISASGGAPNGLGIYAAGVGTGVGVYGEGGASAGWGGDFYGGATSGGGIRATGGAPNGLGVTAQGDGTGAGGDFTGGDSAGAGVVGRGGTGNSLGGSFAGSGSGYGALFVGGVNGGGIATSAGTASTGAVRTAGITLPNGDIDLNGTVAPSATTDMSNRLGPTSFAKVWATLNVSGGVATVEDGLNVSSASVTETDFLGALGQGNDTVVINFASAFANTTYAVLATSIGTGLCSPFVIARSTTSVSIAFKAPYASSPWTTSGISYCASVAIPSVYNGALPTLGRFSILVLGAQ